MAFSSKYKKLATKVIKRTGQGALGLVAYIFLLATTGTISDVFSQRINNKSELEAMLLVERQKLGIRKEVEIEAYFGEESKNRRIGENKYLIVLPEHWRNRNTLRHELFHIADGDCDWNDGIMPKSFFGKFGYHTKYFFADEPQAQLYAATGLILGELENRLVEDK